jgi:hypothetical protein
VYVNPTEFLLPIIAIIVGVVPVLYFPRRAVLLGLAALAYFVAIATKEVVELSFSSFFEQPSIPTYLAYGALTFFFEVGFAYVFLLRFRRGETTERPRSGWTYGIYLAFFENAVLLGALVLLELLLVEISPVHLTAGDPYAANELSLAAPYLGERSVSLLGHGVWGFLAYMATVRRRPGLVLWTIPLAMLDAIAVAWDFTHFVSYPVLILLLLAYTVLTSVLALYGSGLWREGFDGLRRTTPPSPAPPPAGGQGGP